MAPQSPPVLRAVHSDTDSSDVFSVRPHHAVGQQVDLRAHAVVLELRKEAAAAVPQLRNCIRDAIADLGQHRLQRHACSLHGRTQERFERCRSQSGMRQIWVPLCMKHTCVEPAKPACLCLPNTKEGMPAPGC